MAVTNPAICVARRTGRESEKGHPNAAGSPMGIPIRWEPGNRGKTPDRAVGSPGHLGHLTATKRQCREIYTFRDTKELDENRWFIDPSGSRNPGTDGRSDPGELGLIL